MACKMDVIKKSNRGGARPGAGRKPKPVLLEAVEIDRRDGRPIALRARDMTHLALGGLHRVLRDPDSNASAVVHAAREVLDRGYGRAVELKRTMTMGHFEGWTDADLSDLIERLQTIAQPATLINGVAAETPYSRVVSQLGGDDRAEA